MNPEQRTAQFRAAGLTLRSAARLFSRYPSPRVLIPAAALTVAARVSLGRWSRRDVRIAATIVTLEPFLEWLVHVHILHQRPRTFRGRTVDSFAARKHRRHHLNPRDPALAFILPNRRIAPVAVAGIAAVNTAVHRSTRTALTGTATSLLLLTAFEWTHFLMHSSYKPKNPLYREIRRTHQLHHFRNEKYWFGIVTPVSDIVLNTNPAKDEVQPSKTVKTLGITEPVSPAEL
ncbi:sterol desaturase family protein [Kitasatospora sp. MBT63]|uniref:sterol desaturase family protein n=1 Tax=Kitasatospora sp. MBT63 TaxID=1444768 RepID=UPI00068AFA59|nr:sterol desaturase family protein [Kitasatospora sp. MBT63]